MPTGVPLVYELDNNLKPFRPVDPSFGVSGRYLDPEAALASIAAVRNQGRAERRPAAGAARVV